jgi:predicted ribosome quality control (RQC) complex YloA/Tae2 family protein
VASISQAIELALGNPAAAPRALPVNRVLVGQIDELRAQTARKLAALERSLEQAEAASELREAGEAILANLAQIQPGDLSVEFGGQRIELDPHASAVENAERYFRDYRKARDAARQVPRLQEETQLRARQLDELRVLAEVAGGPAQLEAIRDELRQLDRAPQAESSKPGKRRQRDQNYGRVARQRTPDGVEVLLGTSSRGNDLVTFKLAGPEDLWLHARGVPGAHVILRTAGREPSSVSLRFAAELAASNSQARTAGRVHVDYTPRKRVRRIPGAPPGLVTYSGESTLTVRPAETRG